MKLTSYPLATILGCCLTWQAFALPITTTETDVWFKQRLNQQPKDRAGINFKRAADFFINGDLLDAKAVLISTLRITPQHYPSLMLLAALETRRDNASDAEMLLRQASSAKPNELEPKIYLARIYISTNPSQAIELLEPELKKSPEHTGVLHTAGLAYLEAQMPSKAVTALQTLVRLDPNSTDNRMLLAKALLSTGDRETAAQQIEQVLQMAPKHPGALLVQQRISDLGSG